MTGVSGSGKSSLAFDTIYAEGQRRYVESLSAYARQFLERMEKPDVDSIEGICPAIAIRQKNSIRNPRSTVGTTTEIHDYLRLLYARVGRTFCRQLRPARSSARPPEVVAGRLGALPDGTRLLHRLRHAGRRRPRRSLAPAERGRRRGRRRAAEQPAERTAPGAAARSAGSRRSRSPRRWRRCAARGSAACYVDGQHRHARRRRRRGPAGSRHAAGDRRSRARSKATCAPRLTDSIETAYREGGGAAFAIEAGRGDRRSDRAPVLANASSAATCGIAYEVPQPRLFSFNNPFGACPICHGFGNIIELDMDAGRARPVEVDRAERDRAVEQAALPGAARRAEARGRAAACGSTCRGRS